MHVLAGIQAVAKVVVDLVTDDDGKLTDAQIRTYKPSMKHEHAIYKSLKADTPSKPQGIPATWCSGECKAYTLGAAASRRP